MVKITTKSISEIEAELAKWAEFLNVAVGLFSFSLGISCLGTSRPDVTGFISLVFVLLFMAYGRKHFPRKILELRKAELSELDQLKLIGIEKKSFGLRSLLKNFPVFWTGWTFLGGVAIYGIWK